MSATLLDAALCRVAIAEFLAEIHARLPPCWHILDGDDVGSLAFLFGLTEPQLDAIFKKAEILKSKGKSLEYQRNIVDEMLSLMAQDTKGVEFEKCSIIDKPVLVTWCSWR